MIKYFLNPLDCIDITVLLLIILWFLLFTFNKYKRLQLSIFLISHTLFYISKIILNRGNFFVTGLTLLLVSLIAFSIRYIINRKKSEKFSEDILFFERCLNTVFNIRLYPNRGKLCSDAAAALIELNVIGNGFCKRRL